MIRTAAMAWLGLTVAAPLLVVLVTAFAVPDDGVPPFTAAMAERSAQ